MENNLETFNYNKFRDLHLRRREIREQLLNIGALYLNESSLYNEFENLLNKNIEISIKKEQNKKSTKFNLFSTGLALVGIAASVFTAVTTKNATNSNIFTGLAALNTAFFMFDGRSVVRNFKDGRRYKRISKETNFQLGEAINNLEEIENLHLELDKINNNIKHQLAIYYQTTQNLYLKDSDENAYKKRVNQFYILKAFTNEQPIIPKDTEPYYTTEDIQKYQYKDYFNQQELSIE